MNDEFRSAMYWQQLADLRDDDTQLELTLRTFVSKVPDECFDESKTMSGWKGWAHLVHPSFCKRVLNKEIWPFMEK